MKPSQPIVPTSMVPPFCSSASTEHTPHCGKYTFSISTSESINV